MASPLAVALSLGQRIIIRYVQSTLFAFGIVGSLMNIFLFARRNLRNNSCCTYFFFASFSAISLLSMGVIPLLYAQFNFPNPFFSDAAFCKIRIYVNQLSAMSCRWFLVMACIDRCVTCSIHARIRHTFTVTSSRRIAVGLIFIWMILPVHTLIFGNIIPPGNIACVIIDTNMSIYHGLYTLILGGILPPTIMLICTFFIWLSLKNKKKRHSTFGMSNGNKKKLQRDQQVIVILLSQVLIFLISTIPFMANNFYGNFTRGVTNKPADRVAIEGFLGVITELFVYIFPASTFYCNTLVSRTFRQEFLKMFKCFCPRSRQINPTAQTRSQAVSLHVVRANQMNLISTTQTNASTQVQS